MERQVKERLIGAAVLVAIAVILIPELLSGPKTKQQAAQATQRNEQGIKTYQFDLNRTGTANGQFTSSTTAPPAEQVAPPAESQSPESEKANAPSTEVTTPQPTDTAPTRVDGTPPVETSPVPPEETPSRPQPSPPQERAPSAKPPSDPPARASAADTPGWAVQLGSFADAARANQLADRLRAAGHHAYLVPLRRKDGKTLQRVRIGPYGQRSEAEAALKRVASEAKGAAVVSQP